MLGQLSASILDCESPHQSPLGVVTPRGANQKACPVSQPGATEMAGDLKTTLRRILELRSPTCQPGETEWPIWVAQARGGGSWVPTPSQPSCWRVLRRRWDTCGQQRWRWRWPPVDLNTWAFPPETCWVDPLVHTAVGHTGLVARSLRSPQPRWHPGICQDGVGILIGTKSEMPHLQSREWLLCTASTPFPGQGSIPATPGYEILPSEQLADAASKDPGLCKGPPTLGRKSPATKPGWGLPTGRECAGAQMCYGVPDHIYWCVGSG